MAIDSVACLVEHVAVRIIELETLIPHQAAPFIIIIVDVKRYIVQSVYLMLLAGDGIDAAVVVGIGKVILLVATVGVALVKSEVVAQVNRTVRTVLLIPIVFGGRRYICRFFIGIARI